MADLVIGVDIDARKTKAGAKTAKDEIKGVREETDKLGKSAKSASDRDLSGLNGQLGNLTKIAGGAAAGLAAIGAVLLVVAAAAVALAKAGYELAKSFAEYTKEIYRANEITGLSIELLAGLKAEAELVGRSFDEVIEGIKNFTKTIGDANNGNDEASAKLKRLGIDAKDAANSLDKAFEQAIKKILAVKPGVEQMNASIDAFGEMGPKLLPFLKEFGGDLEKVKKKAQELGLMLSGEDVQAAKEFNKALAEVQAVLKGLGIQIGKDFLPVVRDALSDIKQWLSTNKDELKSWGKTFADVLSWIVADVQRTKIELEGLVDLTRTLIAARSFGADWDAYDKRAQGREIRYKRLLNIQDGTSIGNGPWQMPSSDDDYALYRANKLPMGGSSSPYLGGGSDGKKEVFKLSSRGQAIVQAAQKLGVSPLDLATIISFETAGTFSPSISNGKGYSGLIQFGKKERDDFQVTKGQSFEQQILTSVVNYFKVRFGQAGRSTEGASLLDLYTTVIAGNPAASRTARDSNGISAISGVRKMGPHRANALKTFFGGDIANAEIDPAMMSEAVQMSQELLELEARIQSLRTSGLKDIQIEFAIKKESREQEIEDLEAILKLQKELGVTTEFGPDLKDQRRRLEDFKKDRETVADITRNLDANAGRLGITPGVVLGGETGDPESAKKLADQARLIERTLEAFADQTDETKSALDAMQQSVSENVTPLQELDASWKLITESGRLTKEQIDLIQPSFQRLRGEVEKLTEAQKKAAADKAFKELLRGLDDEILDLTIQLQEYTTGLQVTRVELLLMSEAYKTLTAEQQKEAVAKAVQIDALRESLKAAGEARRAYDDMFNTIRDSLGVLAEQGFGAFFKNVMRKFRDFLVDLAAQWLTSKFFQMFFKGGNQQAAASSGSGNGSIFGAIQQMLSGGNGPGATPNFNPNAPSFFSGGGGTSSGGRFDQINVSGLGSSPIPGSVAAQSAGGGFLSSVGGLSGGLALAGAGANILGGAIGGRVGGFISNIGTGVALGAQIGSIIPGVGTAIGAVVGGAVGLFASILGGDPKRKRDKKENIPALNRGFTDAMAELRSLVADVRTLRVSPDGAIARATELRSQIASGFGIKFESNKYRKEAQKLIATRLVEADALIVELRKAAEIANAAGERDRRLIPEFASGVFMSSGFAQQFADFQRRNGMLPGTFTGRDSMPSMLAPGEMVLNPAQQSRVRANAGTDPFVNAGIPGYAEGRAGSVQQSGSGDINVTVVLQQDPATGVWTAIAKSPDGRKVITEVVEEKYRNSDIRNTRRGA